MSEPNYPNCNAELRSVACCEHICDQCDKEFDIDNLEERK